MKLNHLNLDLDLKEELIDIEIKKIEVNPFQPRKFFSPSDIEELAESIRSVGLIHPPVVRRIGEDSYELISGERRLRAFAFCGFNTIKVVVRESSKGLSAEAALIENLQRVDLNPIEIAKSLKNLMGEFSLNQEELSLKVGKKRSTIANYLRLLALPPLIQQGLSENQISMGHAKAILSLETPEKQNLLYELILRDELSVRETELTALRIQDKAKKQKLKFVPRDFYLEQLAEKIQKKLGTKVFIQAKGKKGRLMIDYYNLDDLDRLLEAFGIS